MNASALNIASPAAQAGASGHGASAAAGAKGAGGPLAGFEALLAALFPLADPAAAAPAAGATPATAPIVDGETEPGKGAPKAKDGSEDKTTDIPAADTAASDAAGTATPSDAMMLASVLGSPASPPPHQPTAAAADGTEDKATQAPAWGREKAAGPAQPALLNRDVHAQASEKSAPATATTEGVPAEPTLDLATAPATSTDDSKRGAAPTADAKPETPAWGRDKPQGAPAAPALENANPKANLAEKAAAAQPSAAPPAEPPAPDLAAATTAVAPALAALTQPAEGPPPPKAAPGKPSKSDTVKATSETGAAPDGKPAPTSDKPATARPVEAAAKPDPAGSDVAEAASDRSKPDADTPDATLASDSRAAAQSAAPAATTTHAVRGSPETVAALAAQIVKKLEGRSTRFDLELDPAGLGKVDVRVEIGAHGRMTAAMTCDNPHAAAELRSRASELQRALEQAGFDLSGGLSFDVAGDRGRHQGQGGQEQPDTGGAFRGQAFRAALDTAGDAADAAVNGALKLRRGVNAGLDLRI